MKGSGVLGYSALTSVTERGDKSRWAGEEGGVRFGTPRGQQTERCSAALPGTWTAPQRSVSSSAEGHNLCSINSLGVLCGKCTSVLKNKESIYSNFKVICFVHICVL